jgi:zinc protease
MKQTPKKTTKQIPVTGFTFIKKSGGISEFVLKSNGLRVLHLNRPQTGIITTNITYFVGSRDEARGETGVAHMLEHMLFKPTAYDAKRGNKEADAMLFDQETGCVVNANTWKDRTTYYFSYPKEYLARALRIEAERMTSLILTDKSLTPEQNNVLSEYDMYNGDPYFALGANMTSAAYVSHPYGHETIGHREDIQAYTASALERFYKHYYRPDNAILMVVGDVDETTALQEVKKQFTVIEKYTTVIPRLQVQEPKQEGIRRITIERPSETNVVSIGVKHAGFPSTDWFTASMLFEVLTSGPESILQRALVDTGIAVNVEGSLEPTKEENLAAITITLAGGKKHAEVEQKVLEILRALTSATVTPLLKNAKARALTDETFARDSSMRIVAELTEYASAGDWTLFNNALPLIDSITPKMVLESAAALFVERNMTIGYFIGTNI